MTTLNLGPPVLAAITITGPATAAAVAFGWLTASDSAARPDLATVASLHRCTRTLPVRQLLVPAFGFATAARLDILGKGWVAAAVVLTASAFVTLLATVVPLQRAELASTQPVRAAVRCWALLPGVGGMVATRGFAGAATAE